MKRAMAAAMAAALMVCLWACVCAAAEVERMTNEELLADYTAIMREIETERAALEDERAWMDEQRAKREFDDRIYDELARIVDKRMAQVDERERVLLREMALVEAQRARLAKAERTPVRRYTIKDPLIKRHLAQKIHRYWWND